MRIDRPGDAIKKLAVGGATVATASAVISSPAFAFDDPTPPAIPVVDAFNDGTLQSRLNVRLRPGAATCTASATGGASVVGVAHTSSATPASVDVTPTTGSGVSGPLDIDFERDTNDPASATITYRVQYRCTYATGTSDVCRSWGISYTGPSSFTTRAWNTSPVISPTPGTLCP